MSEKIRIELSGHTVLEIVNTPEDYHDFYRDSFDGISLITNSENYNQGEFKRDSLDGYFEVLEIDDKAILEFIADDGYTFYSVYIYEDSIQIDEKLSHRQKFETQEDFPKGIIKFKNGDFGIDDIGLKSWEKSISDLLQGEIYGFRLLEIETCNLGHEHENEIESCWGFYGYKNQSELITSIILDYVGIDEITLYDDLETHLDKNDLSKIRLKNLIA